MPNSITLKLLTLIPLLIYSSQCCSALDQHLNESLEKSARVSDGERNSDSALSEWHSALVQEINSTFKRNELINNYTCAPPTACELTFEVTRERHIVHMQVKRHSGSSAFDALVVKLVECLDGNSILNFPAGTTNERVPQSLVFAAISKFKNWNDSQEKVVP